MKSHTSKRFRGEFSRLPAEIQRLARRAYARFEESPHHPSLQFRQVHQVLPVYSARVGLHYRALGIVYGDDIVWFWIGSHAEYDSILAQM